MLDQGDAGGGGDRAGLMNVVVPDNYCTQATYRRAVGRRLRTARVVLNISQQDVADAAGCSRNFVSGIERGGRVSTPTGSASSRSRCECGRGRCWRATAGTAG